VTCLGAVTYRKPLHASRRRTRHAPYTHISLYILGQLAPGPSPLGSVAHRGKQLPLERPRCVALHVFVAYGTVRYGTHRTRSRDSFAPVHMPSSTHNAFRRHESEREMYGVREPADARGTSAYDAVHDSYLPYHTCDMLSHYAVDAALQGGCEDGGYGVRTAWCTAFSCTNGSSRTCKMSAPKNHSSSSSYIFK
jgi:hypothetical protein